VRNLYWTFIIILAVFFAALFVDLPGTTDVFGHPAKIQKGIDLAGGARVLLCTKQKNPSSTDMNTARDVINARAAGGIGVSEPQVSRVGANCIAAELPGANSKSRLDRLGNIGFLAVTDSGTVSFPVGTKVKLVCAKAGCAPGVPVGVSSFTGAIPTMQIIVPGKGVKPGSAQVGFVQNQPVVNYNLQGSSVDDWCNYTSKHNNPSLAPPQGTGAYSAIVLDGKVISDPNVQGPICGAGGIQISGVTTDQGKTIATYLNYGALPIALHVDSSQQVAASLGSQYVDEATKAGIIGLVIVALFMLLYYRLPGLLADLALVMYSLIVFAVFKILGVTLTLAGIAGFILSIGMAVDANVLVFERMREELRLNKTLGGAVEAGFRRAWPSIWTSNASTIITTIILFWFGHNFAATVITGFATTLFIGVVISMGTAYFVSLTFLRLLVNSGQGRNAGLFGVETMAGGKVA